MLQDEATEQGKEVRRKEKACSVVWAVLALPVLLGCWI
jgi:hypothetical protein